MRGTFWRRAVSLVNGRVLTDRGVAGSIRFRRRVLGLDEQPHACDVVVDLEGAWVLPGLVNAHDHLELNHYGAWPGRGNYSQAEDWMREVGDQLEHDEVVRRRRSWPLKARLFLGGLKNLLSGVTTVAHHNPRYRELARACPVRVVKRYGWAHSFALERGRAGARGEAAGNVKQRHAGTRRDRPFVLHLAEGTDDRARAELARLDALGCLTDNTVLVHGVALTGEDFARVVARRARLVWCPASNLAMFGQTAPVGQWLARAPSWSRQISIGTDSRLTGSRDLLEELKLAASLEPDLRHDLLATVTVNPARALRAGDCGRLTEGGSADFIVIPSVAPDPTAALLTSARHDIALVVIDGRARIGRPRFSPVFEARGVGTGWLRVDGVATIGASSILAALRSLPEPEPGVEDMRCA